ncbi:bifunctional metallophosphatase/5'-nucleotidase [Halanaerobium hydrogeniformans]|uniref:Metallophosphoesterase n=1 Tax=Halanaerobium hydrogeniformans TaxID=656519 RepID=E4RM47_HALHG|nr:bifunctional UDP-sugar hydrolase/5'-nucleotidase [Halanaerobium hydrogeniformans]ADQ14378.1 metallophosphoesterase [Halanaerobium hydrogeniformans]
MILFLLTSTLIIAQDNKLIVLHTNDIHGRIAVDDDLMGMPYLSSVFKDYQSNYDNLLILDAGDTLHGRPITDQLEGESAVKLMNEAGYTAMAPGNHDFNYGYQRLLELEEMMEFDLIAANVFKEGELLFNPYIIREFAGFRVAIFGLATSDTYSTTHPDNVRGIDFENTVETSQKYLDILKNEENADFVIALTHVGLRGTTEIAESVSGIDLIVDGHSHDLLPSGKMVGETMIVQANEYSKYLGRVEITLNDDRKEIEAAVISASEVKENYQPDPEIEALLDHFSEELTAIMLGL